MDELLPALEAELQRLQLPGRHPRLLACYNRLRQACGKPPSTQKGFASLAVITPASTSSENIPVKAAVETRVPLADEMGNSFEGPVDELPHRSSSSLMAPAATGLSLVDGPEDKNKQTTAASGECPSAVGKEGSTMNTFSIPPAIQLPKMSASEEVVSRVESVFTPGERRRTATAIGDGEQPL